MIKKVSMRKEERRKRGNFSFSSIDGYEFIPAACARRKRKGNRKEGD